MYVYPYIGLSLRWDSWDMTKRPGSKTKAQLRLSRFHWIWAWVKKMTPHQNCKPNLPHLILVLIQNRPKTDVAWVKTHFAIGVSVYFTGPVHRKPSHFSAGGEPILTGELQRDDKASQMIGVMTRSSEMPTILPYWDCNEIIRFSNLSPRRKW